MKKKIVIISGFSINIAAARSAPIYETAGAGSDFQAAMKRRVMTCLRMRREEKSPRDPG